MPHFCATKFFSLIANRLFSMALPERASGLTESMEKVGGESLFVGVTRVLRFFWFLAGIDTYLFGIIWY